MADVPLATAQVIWRADGHSNLPAVKVVDRGVEDDARYIASWGACNIEFDQAPSDKQLQMLLAKGLYITLADGVSSKSVHEAFSVIPEYRDAMREVGIHFQGWPDGEEN